MSVEIQRKLAEILKKRSRDESDFQLRIVVHPTVLERLRTEDEKLLIEMEKKYFGKLSFRADPGMHAEQFKIVNVVSAEPPAWGPDPAGGNPPGSQRPRWAQLLLAGQ